LSGGYGGCLLGNVRCWHKADVMQPLAVVCLAADSGRCSIHCLLRCGERKSRTVVTQSAHDPKRTYSADARRSQFLKSCSRRRVRPSRTSGHRAPGSCCRIMDALLFNQVLTKSYSLPPQSTSKGSSLTRPRSHAARAIVVEYACYHCSRRLRRFPLSWRLFPFQPSGLCEASAVAAPSPDQDKFGQTASATC
jgi:hypothetical protein